MNDDFCYLLRVRYSECDAQKVVFNGRYVDYIDTAVTEFIRFTWGGYNKILADGIDSQVVSLSVNLKAPARFDEVVAVTVKPIRVGTTSYALQIDMYNYESSLHLASAEVVYVMVSVDQLVKMEVPQDMRKQLEEGASGRIVDHAGVK